MKAASTEQITSTVNIISKLSNLAILIIFSLASIITLILRIKFPDIERPFKCPAIYLVCPTSTIMCFYLASHLIEVVGQYLLMWIILTLAIYLIYKLKVKTSPAK